MDDGRQPAIGVRKTKSRTLRFVVPILLPPLFISFLWSIPFSSLGRPETRDTPPPPNDCGAAFMCEGEELVYEVSWLFVKLGQIRAKVTAVNESGEVRYVAKAFVDSYKLPFVDLHVRDNSEMDSAFYSRGFRYLEKKAEGWRAVSSRTDELKRLLISEHSWQPEVDAPPQVPTRFDTTVLSTPRYLDGLSLFYYGRSRVRTVQAVRVTTVVYGKEGKTLFYFDGRDTTSVEIDAVAYPISVVALEGDAQFQGIYGFTGEFKGWFSNDVASIPVRAELKVVLGSINIELKEWHRPGWTPPPATE